MEPFHTHHLYCNAKCILPCIIFKWQTNPGASDSKVSAWNAEDLGSEDPLEKEMAIHSSTIAWKIPWKEKLGSPQSGVTKSRIWLSNYIFKQASMSITNSWSSLKLMSIESVMLSSHLILCCPLLLLTSIPPSMTVFSNESTFCMRWPKYWSFRFSISPSKEHPGFS